MSTKQTIMWTVLPNGRNNEILKLSVLISPRLERQANSRQRQNSHTLNDFSDFLDWPETIRNTTFKMTLQGRDYSAMPIIDNLDSALWKVLFKSTDFVRPYVFQSLATITPISYPVDKVLATVKRPYIDKRLTVMDRLPHVREIAKTVTQVSPELSSTGRNLTTVVRDLRARHNGNLSSIINDIEHQEKLQKLDIKQQEKLQKLNQFRARKITPNSTAPEPNAIEQFKLFHNPAVGRERDASMPSNLIAPRNGHEPGKRLQFPSETDFTNPESSDCLDFHKRVAVLQQYPTLLRKLGLVIDFVVQVDPQLVLPAQPIGVTIQPDTAWQVQTVVVSPKTFTTLTDSSFYAAGHPSQEESKIAKYCKIADGMLQLNDSEEYKIIQVDVDGAATQLINLVSDSSQRNRPQPEEPDQEEGLPAFRTDGLAIIDTTCDQKLVTRLTTGDKNNKKIQSSDLDLYAEELVRGFRIDVWDEQTECWRSLCERIGTYTFTGNESIEVIQDEGWIQNSVTQSAENDEIFVHQKLFNWQGWSLCAPRPGKKIAPDGQAQGEGELNKSLDGLGLKVDFRAVPGSLPRLRFGRRYKLRARVVDLAGNSLTLKDANDAYTTDVQFYARYEPVSSPPLALVEEGGLVNIPKEGESTERLAIRSYNDLAEHNRDPAIADAIASEETAQRYVMPPRISQAEAETHGMLDTEAGRLSASTYQMLADRDPHQNELRESKQVVISEELSYKITKEQGNLKQVDVEQIWEPPQQQTKQVNTSKALSKRRSETTYVAGEVPLNPMPYLPDPFARGIAVRFFDLPEVDPDKVHRYSFYSEAGEAPTTWPNAMPFRIQIVEPSDSLQPTFDSKTRILTVPLPKAEVARLQISCYFHEDDLEQMGIWRWIKDEISHDSYLLEAAKLLKLDDWENEELGRSDKESKLGKEAGIARLYVWEKRKELKNLKRRALNGRQWLLTPWRDIVVVHAVQQPLGTPEIQNLVTMRNPKETSVIPAFDALLHRKSTAKFDLLAEWNDPIDDPKDAAGPRNIKRSEHVSSAPVTAEAPFDRISVNRLSLSYDRPSRDDKQDKPGEHKTKGKSYVTLRHELGDTRYRKVSYQLETTSRFREYLPYKMTTDKDKKYQGAFERYSTKAETYICNAARPDTPDILYVIPTFGWERTETESQVTSTRKGGGLRVYLNRPWYSTGYGEMLAVVLPIVAKGKRIPEELKPYVTQWGHDPIAFTGGGRAGTKLAPFPELKHFPKAITNVQQSIQQEGAREEAQLPDKIGNFQVNNLSLAEQSGQVHVAPHAVHYDPERRLWYCDIEIDAGVSYYPFVRLALARYHPASVQNCHLSPVVMADFAQIAPDRMVTVKSNAQDPKQRHVTVTGVRCEVSSLLAETYFPTYSKIDSTVEHRNITKKPQTKVTKHRKIIKKSQAKNPQIRFDANVSSGLADVDLAEILQSRYLPLPEIEISVEWFDTNIGTDLAWKAVPNAKVTSSHISRGKVIGKDDFEPSNSRILWDGKVLLPAEASGHGRYRLVIKEYERISTSTPGSPTSDQESERRLVYADILELPP